MMTFCRNVAFSSSTHSFSTQRQANNIGCLEGRAAEKHHNYKDFECVVLCFRDLLLKCSWRRKLSAK